jgi:cytochrome c oxidase accessory protein FixG
MPSSPLPTVSATGQRVWLYPRKPPVGKRAMPGTPNFYTLRTWVSWGLLLIFLFGPFIKIAGNPLLMMNILERKFSIFGIMFWPEDMFLFALAMITGFVMIVLFTAAFGRIWCGWLCPQTVLMEMVFRKIEYWIEGDALEQKTLNTAPWTQDKWLKKGLKHGIFFLVSLACAHLLLGYIIGGDALITFIRESPAKHPGGAVSILLFTALFYGIFARFREQACTFICPYGRFQSVLLDENSIVIAYDKKRGEERSRLQRGQSWEERLGIGRGDCVDCGLCVSVCPTGIDIRNGTQMECVNCANCIDACNSVMHKVGRPAGLIRYASQNQIDKGEKLRFTPRLKLYAGLCCGLSLVVITLLLSRASLNMDLLRQRGSWYQSLPDGRVANFFESRFVNKTNRPLEGTLELRGPKGDLIYPNQKISVPAQGDARSVLVVIIDPAQLRGKETPFEIALRSPSGKTLDRVKSSFLAADQPAKIIDL